MNRNDKYREENSGVSPIIATIILIIAILFIGGMAFVAFRSQTGALSKNADIKVQSADLVTASGGSVFSVAVRNTGTVRIDDTKIELQGIPDYPVLQIFDNPSADSGGAGKSISNVAELQDMQKNLNGDYYLAKDINATETKNWSGGFNPIGTENHPFTGTFNGNGYVIKNLYIDRGDNDDIALFGSTSSGAVVENVGLKNAYMHGYDYVGVLVGYNENAQISNCYSTGEVHSHYDAGGLLGFSYQAEVTNCYSTGKASGGSAVGGLVGRDNKAQVTNCYSTGEVSGGIDVGGLVGYNCSDQVNSSFWDNETSGASSSDGGTPKTTEKMKTKSTFTSVGWDFDNVWRMGEVITLDVGSISPGQSASASKSLAVPIVSGKTYLVVITAFDSNGNTILEETITVTAHK